MIRHVNRLLPVGFPMPAKEIDEWAADVDRLRPDVSRDQLVFLFDCFKTGAIEFDKRRGIQNIFEGLKMIEYVNDKWQLREVWPG